VDNAVIALVGLCTAWLVGVQRCGRPLSWRTCQLSPAAAECNHCLLHQNQLTLCMKQLGLCLLHGHAYYCVVYLLNNINSGAVVLVWSLFLLVCMLLWTSDRPASGAVPKRVGLYRISDTSNRSPRSREIRYNEVQLYCFSVVSICMFADLITPEPWKTSQNFEGIILWLKGRTGSKMDIWGCMGCDLTINISVLISLCIISRVLPSFQMTAIFFNSVVSVDMADVLQFSEHG